MSKTSRASSIRIREFKVGHHLRPHSSKDSKVRQSKGTVAKAMLNQGCSTLVCTEFSQFSGNPLAKGFKVTKNISSLLNLERNKKEKRQASYPDHLA